MEQNWDEIDLLCKAAQMMLESGAETYRVEETVHRMAEGMDISVDTVAFPTSIFVEWKERTKVCRIDRRRTNCSRIDQVNTVSRKLAGHLISPQKAWEQLHKIGAEEGYSRGVRILGYAVCAAGFSLLFGGKLNEFLVSFLIGSILQTLLPVLSRFAHTALFSNIIGGFMTATLAMIAFKMGCISDFSPVIVGGIMPLLSGLLMTTGIRDAINGDLISGMARIMEAALLAASVALGVFVSLSLFSGV